VASPILWKWLGLARVNVVRSGFAGFLGISELLLLGIISQFDLGVNFSQLGLSIPFTELAYHRILRNS
jgi:hypothetical protein